MGHIPNAEEVGDAAVDLLAETAHRGEAIVVQAETGTEGIALLHLDIEEIGSRSHSRPQLRRESVNAGVELQQL